MVEGMSIREHCADVWPAPGHRAQNAGLFGPAGLSPTVSAQEAQPFDQLRRSPSPASSTGSWRTDPGRSRKQRHTAKRIYTRHGGVNDPAGLPAWRLGSTTAGASSWLSTAGAGMAKTTCPGERSQATVQRRGVIALRKQRCCLRSSTVGGRVRPVPLVTSGGQKTGCPNRGLHVGTTGEITWSAALDGPDCRIPGRGGNGSAQ